MTRNPNSPDNREFIDKNELKMGVIHESYFFKGFLPIIEKIYLSTLR